MKWRRTFRAASAVIVYLSVGLAAEGQDAPKISCKPVGRDFACVSIGAEDLKILPRWVLYTTPRFESFGLDFEGRAPKRWTYITANFYSYNEAREDLQACVEVSQVGGGAKFRECAKPRRP